MTRATDDAATEICRITRVLEYQGPREWLETTLNRNAVKGTLELSKTSSIREAEVGRIQTVGHFVPYETAYEAIRQVLTRKHIGGDISMVDDILGVLGDAGFKLVEVVTP